jgi:hypothetical protein
MLFSCCTQRKPSLKRPEQADGVYCLSKLQGLVHVVGHIKVSLFCSQVHDACCAAVSTCCTQRKPSLKRPVQADGVYCLSKLEWLVHAMGHEMVHCIVHNACPTAREYEAYKVDNGHGPIFMRLNK